MSKSILIVEDEIAIADNIAYALRTEGFAPHHVSLEQKALDVLQTGSGLLPELVVLDVGLPDINGFEVCRRLRQFSDILASTSVFPSLLCWRFTNGNG